MTLQNGSVLAVGGMSNENHLPYMTSAELYDPATNTWARVASPKRDRYGANAVTLANGSVLLAGGTANTPSNNGHATEVCTSPSITLPLLPPPAERLWVH